MSASEKEKALNGQLLNGPWDTPVVHPSKAILTALPQIVAVVEAAEHFWSDEIVDGRDATQRLGDALTALDEALGVDVT